LARDEHGRVSRLIGVAKDITEQITHSESLRTSEQRYRLLAESISDVIFSTGSDLIRLQCPFVDTPEVDRICDFIGSQQGYPSAFILPEYVDENADPEDDFDIGDRDSMFEEAAHIVVLHQQGSASLLQRKLKLGYNRAGRIIDQLEKAGIIGPFEGSKARKVLYKDSVSLEQFLKSHNE
jgi:S-DNA-T family DNA segregation ATPase FtsK/SpoIIIE